MKNKIILPIIFLIIWPLIMFGQTATVSIGSVTANPGDDINVPINVSSFTDVGAITLYIGYDPAVLSYQGLNNIHPEVSGIYGNAMTNPDQIGLVWIANPPNFANIASGKMLDLHFTYIGGSCDLVFNAGCEIVDSGLQPIPVNYSGGSVGPIAQPVTASIGTVLANAGDEVLIPVDVTGFIDVGAITFFIGYDESVLTFIGIENINSEVTGLQGNAMTNPTEVGIVWSADPPNSANVSSGKLFDLKFFYKGGNCDLIFSDDCEVTDPGLVPIYVDYTDGNINQASSSLTAYIGDVTASIGQEVLVPMDVTNFSDVAAMTFYIGYDPAVVSFIGLENIDPAVNGINANTLIGPDRIVVVWTATPPNYLSITGKLFDLKFIYNGGDGILTFDPGCEVTNSLLISLPVTYFNGSVSLSTEETSITTDIVFSDPGFEVLVPVTTLNFSNIGALTLYIGYDPAALSFIGLENIHPQISGVVANTMSAPDRIGIAWTANPPSFANIADDKLFDLKFVFNGGNGSLNFIAGCELTNSNLMEVPVSLYDGGVYAPVYLNLKDFLEGPFNGEDLDNSVNNILPLGQSYNKLPWNYAGVENVPSMPDPDIVDWILIELRETSGNSSTATPDKRIASQAGFIFKDGTIVGHATLIPIRFDIILNDNLYAVIWHRNHLGVMSALPLAENAGIYTYDFTTGGDKAYGGIESQKEVAPGVWAMISGDGDANGLVDINDKLNIWSTNVGKSGYLEGDFNMDGQIDNQDKSDAWISNINLDCKVPN
ncbi:MAG: cohesin domain-containing protein [Bacteroidales bacterium]